MPDNPSRQTEHQNPTAWFEKIQKWAVLASTILGWVGLTAANSFKWLEDHPHLKLGLYLASLALFITAAWLFRSHVKGATKTRQSSLNVGGVVTEPKYHRRVVLTVTLFAIACTFGLPVWGYYLVKGFLDETNKLIILVATFDGNKEDEQKVTSHIYEAIDSATKGIPNVKVRALNEVITVSEGSEKARRKGEARNARIVVWGWYDSDLVGVVHIEFLQKPQALPLSDNSERRFNAVAQGERGFEIKQRLSGEMSYLTLLVIGLTKLDAKDYDGAIELFTKAIQYPSPDALISPSRLFYYKAYAECFKGQFDRAIADFTKTIELKPDDAHAYYNRGVAYGEKKEFDRAIADYIKAIELKPDDPLAYINRGNAYNEKKEFDRAIADYTKAIELKPDYVQVYTNRGVTYREKKEFDRAIADYTKAIELKPDYAPAYYNRGNAYDEKKEFDRAIADFSKAIELKPDYADAYTNRGVTYRKIKAYDRAIADFTRTIELKPDDAHAYANRGFTYRDINEYYRAIADISKAIELKLDDPLLAYTNRGAAYRAIKAYDRAIADYTKAIELKPDDAHVVYNNRGAAYGEKKEFDRAIADFTKAIELKPDDPLAYTNRGKAYEECGNINSAIDDF